MINTVTGFPPTPSASLVFLLLGSISAAAGVERVRSRGGQNTRAIIFSIDTNAVAVAVAAATTAATAAAAAVVVVIIAAAVAVVVVLLLDSGAFTVAASRSLFVVETIAPFIVSVDGMT